MNEDEDTNESISAIPSNSETTSIVRKATVKRKFLSSIRGFFGTSSTTMSWSDFVNDYLADGKVDRLEIGHDGWARVHLKKDRSGTSSDQKSFSEPTSAFSWFNWTSSFKLPSLLSWEFDDVSSTTSSSASTDSIDSSETCSDVLKESDFVNPVNSEPTKVCEDINTSQSHESSAKIFLQIGRPSYLERNLKLAYQRLNTPPSEFIHIVYHDRKHLGTSSSGIGTALFSLFLTILPVLIILKIGRDLKTGGGSGEGAMGGFADFFTGGTASKAEVNPDYINVTFADVAGCDEAKVEILEFVNFLKHPDKYIALGAKVPHGAILYGPPGTGKTLLAKAAAKEAGVPFLAQSGSEFTELFVGMGPLRMRSLFASARSKAPCILFIDEIDAIGRKRGGKFQGGNNEEENTLNQLLSEMDGFKTGSSSVIVLGATNRLDILDKALLRPGRFDRHIEVTVPDIKGRASIFKVHLAGIKTVENVTDIARHLAALTHGFSGAEIANVCNEAALVAAREGCDNVQPVHFKAALERVVAGLERKSRRLQPDERKKVAFHEAGHAVSGWFLRYANPLLKVSIIPRGKGLGYALYQPEEKFLYTKDALLDIMCMSLGGRAAEIIFFGEFTTGAQDDLRKVTESAYSQILRYGMNDNVGHVSFNLDEGMVKPYSEATGSLVDEEVRLMIKSAMDRTLSLLRDKKDLVQKLAELLLEKEVLEREDMVKILGNRPWAEKTSYDDFVAGTGSFEEDPTLPVGLRDWNSKLDEKSEDTNSFKSNTDNNEHDSKDNIEGRSLTDDIPPNNTMSSNIKSSMEEL